MMNIATRLSTGVRCNLCLTSSNSNRQVFLTKSRMHFVELGNEEKLSYRWRQQLSFTLNHHLSTLNFLSKGFYLSRGNSGSELIPGTQGKRSSVQIAAFGGCNSGQSIEQVVTSTRSESTASWIKIGVPQQVANDLNRVACSICLRFPDKSRKSSLGTETHATPCAALARRQSRQ
jgi:hypothetical protein